MVLIVGCGDGTGPDPITPGVCDGELVLALSAGEHSIIDPLVSADCIRLAGEPLMDAEYVVVPFLADGHENSLGTRAAYWFAGEGAATPMAVRGAAQSPKVVAGPLANDPGFHASLRTNERRLALRAGPQALRGARLLDPPTLGHQRTFSVCADLACADFAQVEATARFVGSHGVIYLDDNPPADGFTQEDLDNLGLLFDQHLYPIDTAAFGHETDIDGNGMVVVLLTPRVNQLIPNCNSTGTIVLGYFYALDLLPSEPFSNASEVMYGLVPDPSNGMCTVSRETALDRLPSVLVHELQHMISAGQHLVARGGDLEEVWLNEGLSHYAEELAARQVPDEFCPGLDCLTYYALPNVSNANRFLLDPEEAYLVEPATSAGTLADRGANWLFVRWLTDHFGGDPLGTELTRALVNTGLTGGANVESATGVPFDSLAGDWLLANYLDDLPSFAAISPRLEYRSWNWRETYASLHQQNPLLFPRSFPLVADLAVNRDYQRIGVVRAGTGPFVRVVVSAGEPPRGLRLTDTGGESLPERLIPRIAVVRLR